MPLIFHPKRLLTEDRPEAKYAPSKSEAFGSSISRKGLHYGQRKLLLSEIEFLCAAEARREAARAAAPTTVRKPMMLVYAGAANGLHIPLLLDFFPHVRLVLIDPAPFCAAVRALVLPTTEGESVAAIPSGETVESEGPIAAIVQDYCTDELCLRLHRRYGGEYELYLISDIRSGVPKGMTSNFQHTEMMNRDNEWQKSWCWSLQAEAAMLKFHPPYPRVEQPGEPGFDPEDKTPDAITYLDGSQLFGVWAPKSSSEVRLVVEGPFTRSYNAPMRSYHCRRHESQCYYYNIHDRHASDCEAERIILGTFQQQFPHAEILKKGPTADVEGLSSTISRALGFPDFNPLTSTEDAARWATHLYSTVRFRRAPNDFTELYHRYKDHLDYTTVMELVRQYKDAATLPTDGMLPLKSSTSSISSPASVPLTESFWSAFRAGNFSESYSFPGLRWASRPPQAPQGAKGVRKNPGKRMRQ